MSSFKWKSLSNQPMLIPGISQDTRPDDKNPVVTLRTRGWDSHQVDLPSVVYHDGIYRMWFSGFDGFHWRIGFAESEDGITWDDHPHPVLEGTAEAWDSDGVWSSSVLWDGTSYMMWYAGTRRSIPHQDRNAAISHVSQSSDIGLTTSMDGLVWVKQGTEPVLKEGDSPSVFYANGIYRLWYNFTPRGKVVTTPIPLRYTTSQNGISWRSDTRDLQATNSALDMGVRHPSVLLCGDQYLLWYHTTTFQKSKLRLIKGFEARAMDVARIRLNDLRIVDINPHGDWSEMILELVFVNEGPGDAQAIEVKLLETESGVRSLSPAPILQVGDLMVNQTARTVEPLRLLIQGPPQTTDTLNLFWQIAYTDTVMGDRQVYKTEPMT